MKSYSTIHRAPFCSFNPDGISSTFLSNFDFSTGLFSINKGALLRSTAIEDRDFTLVASNRPPFFGLENSTNIDLLNSTVGNFDSADISKRISPSWSHYFNIPINRFVLGLFLCALCAGVACFLTPASSGTWGEVINADCASFKNENVLMSADAFIAAKCGAPKLGVT